MSNEQLMHNMRERIDQCRRLADMSHNAEISDMLNKMADDGEADLIALQKAEARAAKPPAL